MIKKLLFLSLLFISLGVQAQEQWEFSNSTPYKTVKSHFYFLEKDHYNPKLATYVLGKSDLNPKAKELRVIKLKSILKKMGLKLEDIPDRRKGIIEKDKYQFFPNEPSLYLVRVNRKWGVWGWDRWILSAFRH